MELASIKQSYPQNKVGGREFREKLSTDVI